ncbi:DUF5056 domain-containing protein [Prevotella sp. AM34-19LB]|uniref:DUF5056 domain-containing protein n=1 Tax=Prevotella sp. AM34-19LB TaxID=2292364 RepID=UPI001F2FDC07|nr:DUF5056 domain-containing protein [Prevotella sp. AM34-19LB]
MTDKMIDNMNGMELEPLSATDDQLLQAFFADNRMEEVPDDGFSDRVMQALPGLEPEKTLLALDQEKTVLSLEQEQALAKRRRLEHLWTAACVAVGIVAAVVCQGWEQIQGWLFSMKIDFLLTGSRALTHLADAITPTQNLLMMLAGIVVLVMVWGYNELADAR